MTWQYLNIYVTTGRFRLDQPTGSITLDLSHALLEHPIIPLENLSKITDAEMRHSKCSNHLVSDFCERLSSSKPSVTAAVTIPTLVSMRSEFDR